GVLVRGVSESPRFFLLVVFFSSSSSLRRGRGGAAASARAGRRGRPSSCSTFVLFHPGFRGYVRRDSGVRSPLFRGTARPAVLPDCPARACFPRSRRSLIVARTSLAARLMAFGSLAISLSGARRSPSPFAAGVPGGGLNRMA